METPRFLGLLGVLGGFVALAVLVALFQLGQALGGFDGFGGDDEEGPPAAQERFLETVVEGQDAAGDANDVRLVQADLDRDAALCGGRLPGELSAEDLAADDWWGTVQDIETGMGDDAAQLRIQLDHDVELVVDDRVPGEGVQPGSSLYEAVAALVDGDDVVVSGRFVKDPEGCLAERSLRLRNSLLTPDFDFVLTGIDPR